MSDGWCEKCDRASLKDCGGAYTYLCKEHTLQKASDERAEILRIVNQPGLPWKTRRVLLKHKFGFADVLIDELVGKEEPTSDY